ncbi:MAG: ABC transporter permease [Candidatus Limnocylindria bacterium]
MTPGEPLIRWDWVADHLPDIAGRVGEHLLLAGIALVVGFAIAFAISVAVVRRPVLYATATWIAGILYTIPSLALFVLLVPFTGLTLLTAEIGLVSYTLLILMRNIVAGIRGIPADAREAAIAMGYTPRQVLARIELPLALPAIVAGVRVAAVTTIGLVTVTALIGQGGLGALILEGILRFFSTPLIVGAVLSVALAIAVDAALVLVQRAATPWART